MQHKQRRRPERSSRVRGRFMRRRAAAKGAAKSGQLDQRLRKAACVGQVGIAVWDAWPR